MQQGHLYLTKENFLSETEKEINGNTKFPNRVLFTNNECYVHHNFGGPHGPD